MFVPRVRLDDAVRGIGYEFEEPGAPWAATDLSEVRPALVAAEAASRDGWVVGFVTYDAAPAFDTAFPVTAVPALELPLAWFATFRRRVAVPLVSPPECGVFVDELRRRHGADWYCAGVETIRDLIESGDVYQVNLTDRLRGRVIGEPFDLYRSMVAAQRGAFNAFIDLGSAVVISASPELFLEIEGETATTRPMKGTRRRHGRAERDRMVAEELRWSAKDRAENVMIVDLLRNDLARVSSPGGVRVPALFEIERYETVWQMTSTVSARLRPDVGLADIFRATFPCGSVTGAPKVAAMRVISQLEPSPRGLYCGAIGVVAPAAEGTRPSSVWSVAIRTAVVDRAEMSVEFGAGGGITFDSVPEDEDNELESKTAVLRDGRTNFELFETLRLDALGANQLDAHLRRLAGSADFFGFPHDCSSIAADIEALPVPTQPMRLRISVDRHGVHRIVTSPMDDAPAHVRLAIGNARVASDDPFMCHKTSRRIVYDRALKEHPQADDVVLVNERNEVVEATRANLLYRLNQRWYTPPLSCGGLPGIGRAMLLAQQNVAERVLPVHELVECEEFAVVNSLRGRRSAEILI